MTPRPPASQGQAAVQLSSTARARRPTRVRQRGVEHGVTRRPSSNAWNDAATPTVSSMTSAPATRRTLTPSSRAHFGRVREALAPMTAAACRPSPRCPGAETQSTPFFRRARERAIYSGVTRRTASASATACAGRGDLGSASRGRAPRSSPGGRRGARTRAGTPEGKGATAASASRRLVEPARRLPTRTRTFTGISWREGPDPAGRSTLIMWLNCQLPCHIPWAGTNSFDSRVLGGCPDDHLEHPTRSGASPARVPGGRPHDRLGPRGGKGRTERRGRRGRTPGGSGPGGVLDGAVGDARRGPRPGVTCTFIRRRHRAQNRGGSSSARRAHRWCEPDAASSPHCPHHGHRRTEARGTGPLGAGVVAHEDHRLRGCR